MASISEAGADLETERRGGAFGEDLGVWYAFADSGMTASTSLVVEEDTPLTCGLLLASGCSALTAVCCCAGMVASVKV